MAIEIKVPALGESVTEATVGQWFKQPGDAVNVDEPLIELETDKVTVEVPSPSAGVLASITVPQGKTVAVGAVLGAIDGAGARAPAARTGEGGGAAARRRCPDSAAARAQRPQRCRWRRRHAAGAGRAQDPGGKGVEPRRRRRLRAPWSDPETGRVG